MGLLDEAAALAPEPARAGRPMGSLVAERGVAPHEGQWEATGGPKPPVQVSPDLLRVMALLYREPPDLDGPEGRALVERVTPLYRRERTTPCRCKALGRPRCILELKPAQAWALEEAPRVGGLVGNIEVGGGKAGLDILLPVAMGWKKAVVVVPSNLVKQLESEYLAWAEHWRVPDLQADGPVQFWHQSPVGRGMPHVRVISYNRLSRPDSTTLLEELDPDGVVADECQKLKNVRTATVQRFLRAVEERRKGFCGFSGTVIKDSIKNFWRLLRVALWERSPVPVNEEAMLEWAGALDPSNWPAPPGALLKFCQPGEHVHAGFQRRLRGTPGVIVTKSSSVPNALYLRRRDVDLPADPVGVENLVPGSVFEHWRGTLAEMITLVRDSEQRPDGEELVEKTAVASCCRQLASGFFYRWKFPRGEAPELIDEWRAKRKAWHRELREKLNDPKPHLDSPLLCAKAAIRYHAGYEGDLPVWEAEHWLDWRAIRDKVYHETEVVRVHDFLARDAAAWAKKNRGIVWYLTQAFGQWVAELSGLKLYGAGAVAKEAIAERVRRGDNAKAIICSIPSHGVGTDGLQYLYADMLVAEVSSSGLAWEQLLGRQHRMGQPSDEVTADIYGHTDDVRAAFEHAVDEATFVNNTIGSAQKLLLATKIGMP